MHKSIELVEEISPILVDLILDLANITSRWVGKAELSQSVAVLYSNQRMT